MAKKKQKKKKIIKKELPLKKKIGKIQQEIGTISKNKENPYYKSKYFDINKLLEELLPLFDEYGLTVTQPLGYSEQNDRTLIKTIIQDDDDKIEFSAPLPQNRDPQKMGKVITYYRRYLLTSFFCLQAEDDDGNEAAGKTSKGEKTETAKDKGWD